MGVSVEKGVHGSHCVRPSSPHTVWEKNCPTEERGPSGSNSNRVGSVQVTWPVPAQKVSVCRWAWDLRWPCTKSSMQREMMIIGWPARPFLRIASGKCGVNQQWGNVEWISSEETLRRQKDKKKLRPAELQKGKALGRDVTWAPAAVLGRVWGCSHPGLSGLCEAKLSSPLSLCGGRWSSSSEVPKGQLSAEVPINDMSHHPNPW